MIEKVNKFCDSEGMKRRTNQSCSTLHHGYVNILRFQLVIEIVTPTTEAV